MFPQNLPALRTFEYSGACIQAPQVGGDYYDFLESRPGRGAASSTLRELDGLRYPQSLVAMPAVFSYQSAAALPTIGTRHASHSGLGSGFSLTLGLSVFSLWFCT
jgi:hypothetical protein